MRCRVGIAAVSLVAPLSGLLVTSVAPATAAPNRGPAAAPVEIVSADGEATNPAVSADGRYVAFAGTVPLAERSGPTPRQSTIWLRDRYTGLLSELTPRDDRFAPANSIRPAISADGCYVTFLTEYPYDLFRDDDIGKRWDVYRLKTPPCGGQGDVDLVSIRTSIGKEPTASNDVPTDDTPAISGAGGIVAYTARFGGNAPAGLTAVNVVDLTVPIGDPGRTRPVGGTPDNPPATVFTYRGLRQPSLSDDGQLVGFLSDARSDLPERRWSDGPAPGKPATTQAFVWDRSNFDPLTAVVEISAGRANPDAADPANGEATAVRLSGDGRFVAFASRATNLLAGTVAFPPCVELCPTQIFRVDRLDGSTELVSKVTTPAGEVQAADQGAVLPSINFDGNEVAFISRSTNLFLSRNGAGTGAPSDGDVIVASLDAGQMRRISLLADGVTPAPPAQSNPAMSANGRVVVFDTAAAPGFGATTAGRAVAAITEKPVLAMNDLDVGTVSVGFTGPEWYIPVRNGGPSTFVPASVVSTNADFVITGGTCDQGEAIPPGGSCTVNVVLLPSVEGPIEGQIKVAEVGFNSAEVSATVRGAGGVPALNPTVGGHSFNPAFVRQASPAQAIEVRNVGLDVAPMSPTRITGRNAADFKITADGCRGRSLAPSATCSVEVVFNPTSDGMRNASVEFATTSGQYTTVLLSGSGVFAPELVTAEPQFVAGRVMWFGVRGFRPNSVVHLAWADGRGRRTQVVTNGDGAALLALRVGAVERAGERTIVATSDDGLQASLPLRVIAPTVSQRATSPVFDD